MRADGIRPYERTGNLVVGADVPIGPFWDPGGSAGRRRRTHMAVFPQRMDKLDLKDVPGSLAEVERYISYMIERIEFLNHKIERLEKKG